MNARQIKVRLAEIDCPEAHQPDGAKAKKALGTLVFGGLAQVVAVDRDRYGRVVGSVSVEGLDVNAALVRQGHGWG